VIARAFRNYPARVEKAVAAERAALRQRVDELVRLNRQQEPGGLACLLARPEKRRPETIR